MVAVRSFLIDRISFFPPESKPADEAAASSAGAQLAKE
jgi:hypothetical protein